MIRALPELHTSFVEHSDRLRQHICRKIDEEGALSFAAYMQMALYEPELGYYRCGAQKFGAQGDFVTAPELSPLFAQCLAQRCKKLFDQYDHNILEIGAGSGALAVDILRALEQAQCLPQQYYILELSSELVVRQQQWVRQHIPQLYDRFVWLNAWPHAFDGVIIANELFDAMPVHRFIIKKGVQEYFVTHHNGQLQWFIDRPSTPCLQRQLDSYQIDFAEGYVSEINLQLAAWIKSLCDVVVQAHMIFIDYGYKRDVYYHPERHMGTLMCHLQHRAHDDPLIYPGIQDITSHVDFTLVAEAALASRCDVAGLSTQAQYLLGQGIIDLLSRNMSTTARLHLTQQAKQLMMPGHMGEAFKVLELSKHKRQ